MPTELRNLASSIRDGSKATPGRVVAGATAHPDQHARVPGLHCVRTFNPLPVGSPSEEAEGHSGFTALPGGSWVLREKAGPFSDAGLPRIACSFLQVGLRERWVNPAHSRDYAVGSSQETS